MSKKLSWIDYLNRLEGSPSDRAIAKASGVSPSMVSRWRSGQAPRPMHVVSVARAFNNPPLLALVQAGYLTLDDVDEIFDGQMQLEVFGLADFSTTELADELARRVRALEADTDGVG